MITHKDIGRVYSGKTGCMCGCNGNYNDSDHAKKSALTRMLKKDYVVQMLKSDKEYVACMYYDDGNRNNVIYIKTGAAIEDELKERIVK